jgi:hypothetical protein
MITDNNLWKTKEPSFYIISESKHLDESNKKVVYKYQKHTAKKKKKN